MSDLNDQLRNYIDGLARPISVNETMSRQPQRRPLALAAVLAGAAVVLLPALVIAGIRWWPGGSIAEPSTMPPVVSTTTTIPDDTTTSTLIEVPSLDGMTEEDASTRLSQLGLQLAVTEQYPARSGFGLITAQSPAPGENAEPGSTVEVGVAIKARCLGNTIVLDVPQGSMQVNLLFECAGDGVYPDIAGPIPRAVAESPNVVEATLTTLLAGLTDDERAMGYSSFFSAASADALNSVELDGDHLIVDFNDAILINNASTTTGGTYFMAELQTNLFQFPAVDTIEFRLNGSCKAFGDWMQIGECPTWTRTDWEQRVAAWNAERDAAASPDTSELQEVVGSTFAGELDKAHIELAHTGGAMVNSGFDEVQAWPVTGTTGGEPGDDWLVHVARSGHEMLWLVRLQQTTEDRGWLYTVRAELEIPWDEIMPELQADGFVQDGTDACTINGESDPTLVALTELVVGENDTVTGETKPLRAWRIDVEGARIHEIPTDGIECFFAGW